MTPLILTIIAIGRPSADIARENIVAYVCIAAVLIVAIICFTYLTVRIGPPKLFKKYWFGTDEDESESETK